MCYTYIKMLYLTVFALILLAFLLGRYMQDLKIRGRISETVKRINGCEDILVGNAINHIFCLNLFSDEDIRKVIEGIIGDDKEE